MRYFGVSALLVLTLAWQVLSQENQPIFRGLILNETTQAAAIQSLGKPHKVEMKDISAWKSVSKAAAGEKRFQSATYKKIDGWDEVQLTFYQDKLISVKIMPGKKKMLASELPGNHKSNFVMVEALARDVNLSVFEGQKDPDVPRPYPIFYFMVTAFPDRFIVALVGNNSWKSMMAAGRPSEKKYPGYVSQIEFLSRKFETDPDARK